MGKRVTIKDVANHVGVSTATISYYINGRYENISDEMCQQIKKAIADLDYRPSAVARNLRTSKTRTIGLIITGLRGNISFQGVNGVCEHLNTMNYDTMVFMTNDSGQKEREYLQRCVSNGCEGIIVIPSSKDNYDLMKKIHREGVPIVIQSRYDKDIWPYDAAALDYRSIASLMQYLVQKGYERVAFFIDSEYEYLMHASTNKRLRREVFLQSTRTLFHVSGEDLIYCGVKDEVHTRECLRNFIARYPNKRKAVVAVNSPVMLQLYYAIRKENIQDTMLCGYGGAGYTDLMFPKPIVLTQPLKKIGVTAAKLMLSRLEDPSAPPRVVLIPSELVVPDQE